MSQYTYSVTDSHLADGQPAKGTDVASRDNDTRTFLLGNNLDTTDNINPAMTAGWTGTHSWTVSNANTTNMALTVGAVMASSKYGFSVTSSAAQINSSLCYVNLSSGSSTVACLELVNAGTGATLKITNTADASAISGTLSSTSAASAVISLSQAGTGPLVGGTLRTLTGLKGEFTLATLVTPTTVSNTATNTEITDLIIALPANFLKAGTTIRGTIWGILNTPGSGVPSARVRLYYGGTSGTVLLDSGAVTHGTSLSNSLVAIDFMATCLTIGGSGTIQAQGCISWSSNTAPALRGLGTAGTGAGNSSSSTIDTTLAKNLSIAFAWGSAVSGASVTFTNGTFEILA